MLEYSAVGGAATDQRAKRYEIDVKTVRELADLRGYRRYAHGHAVVNKLDLVTLSDISDMNNSLTKCSKNAFGYRKERFIRSNDRVEKAELCLFRAPCYWSTL